MSKYNEYILNKQLALTCHHELWMGIADWCTDIEYLDIDADTVRVMYLSLKRSLVASICVKYNIKTNPGLSIKNNCFLCEFCDCACGLCPLNYGGTVDCLDGLYDKFCNELNDCTLGHAAQVARVIANIEPKDGDIIQSFEPRRDNYEE